jgi:predicted AlkP superfamily pyrophosphatase or phosphodiesterase
MQTDAVCELTAKPITATHLHQRLLRVWLIALVLCVLLCSCAVPTRPAARYTPLILISIDGYRADYFARGLSPTLAALAADGVHAQSMRSAFPTLTFPNHYTIVTGLYPDHHGIVNNRFIDPATGEKFIYNDPTTTADPKWWGGEPLWVSAQRQGKHAATMFWPGTNVAIDGVRPERWAAFDGNMTPHERVAHALEWLDLPPAQRPDFLTLYFEQVDHAGHDHGPDAPEVNAALGDVDRALGELIDGLKQRHLFDAANIAIVSDHGLTSTSPDRVLVLDDIIDIGDADVINTGILAGLAAKPGHEAQVEQALLAPHEHMQCWKKQDVPARLHYGTNPRIPPLLCLADDGWLIGTREAMSRPNHHISLGEHGYDNDDPNMRALFIAHGPAFRHGLTIPQFNNVDLYPLLARLLRIHPAPNDGNPATLAPVLAPEWH